ncbi:RING finger protein 112-like [Hemicordylus capensis]|uniref:RING finger protein 112-like n=1 Tax=Hemicordylus capensis TaxID=884348 RepID=UPI00230223FF|nr:RING finger protein 112-like [Hemicordylus capensis]
MGQEDEPLTGFQWKPGTDSTTKGVWIWSQPFWIPIQTGKVAVFLIDTEGLMNLETKKEVSVKLSAFSMLLSSFQILNVERMWKDTDSEYLEMCVQVADAVGRACSLESLQHLDVLVRDWSYPAVFGKQAGQTYLQDVIQKMERDSSRHPKALRTLKNESSRCYTMPHPGKRLQSGITGTLAGLSVNAAHVSVPVNRQIWDLCPLLCHSVILLQGSGEAGTKQSIEYQKSTSVKFVALNSRNFLAFWNFTEHEKPLI